MKKLLVMIGLGLALLAAGCVQVNSDEVGVRVINLPLPVVGGVESQAKTTGTYWYIPGLVSFYKFPKTQQKLEMIEEERGPTEDEDAAANVGKEMVQAPEQGYELKLQQVADQVRKLEQVKVVPHSRQEGKNNIRLKTADGNDVWVDAVVSFQVIEDKASVLVQKVGYTVDDITNLVGPMARSVVRSVLGELKTGEIYDARAREERIEKARGELNAKLNPFGIKVTSLTVPEFRFSKDYENIIREKALAEQKRQEYERLQLAAEQEKAAKKNKATGDADANIALAQGRKLRAQQEADATLYAKTQEAEAQHLRLLNEAAGMQVLAPALAGPGGEAQVAREVARSLQGKKILLVPAQGAINVLDINELLQTYGAVKALQAPAAPKPTAPVALPEKSSAIAPAPVQQIPVQSAPQKKE